MRKFAFVFVTAAMILLIVLSIQADRIPSDKLLFKQTLYSQLTTDDTLIVEGFANRKNLYTDSAAIESIYLSSLDEHYKLVPTLDMIEKGGEYNYLGDVYIKYRYIFKLPKLEVDYYIKSCYMTMILKNGDHLQVSIGRLSLMRPSHQSDLSIVNQYGENEEGSSYLSKITLDVKANRLLTIQTICYTVSHCTPIDQVVTDSKTIHIDLGLDVFHFNQTPLRVNYLIDGIEHSETIDTFRYFETLSSDIPENSQNRVYVID
ncbi:hypothetical protein N7603_04435 [Acholeplasma vituli]|uniref:Uncharacterized protein n=1 Tax=Paracholeplasma vituli TaxID=69473 RepID=A0ABT2PW04_9MOLU|nr:hypothetical protein [Paracholeplasma vituli]MCU0104898.1 hypothetical protein [Paracholeplasma vituli]